MLEGYLFFLIKNNNTLASVMSWDGCNLYLLVGVIFHSTSSHAVTYNASLSYPFVGLVIIVCLGYFASLGRS